MSLKKGLVLDLDISSEGLQGTTKFKDKTPYENNGTLSNVTLTTDHKGKANSAGLFNGTSSYIVCGNNSSLDITDEITISAWVKINGLNPAGWQGIVMNTPSTTIYNFGIGVQNNTYKPYAVFRADNIVQLIHTTSLTRGEWNMITLTVDDVNMNLYINGADKVSTAKGTLGSTFADTIIGTFRTNYLNGSIERPQIWNRALSADEVKLLYESYNPCLMIVKGGIG